MTEFTLVPGEHITRAVRKHWFVLLLEVLPFFLLALAPLFIPALFEFVSRGGGEFIDVLLSRVTVGNEWIRLFLGLWWLVLWIAAFNSFTSYYLNEWIITTHRIIEIQQHGFFDREVSGVHLNHVQDVSTDVHGLFATLLGFGSLTVQSAGVHNYFHMHGIPNPESHRNLVMKEIADLHAKDKKPA